MGRRDATSPAGEVKGRVLSIQFLNHHIHRHRIAAMSGNKSAPILALPNEILLGIFSLFHTTDLLPFGPTCKHFHSLTLRVIHHRLQVAASLDGHALYSEVSPPYKKYSSANFFCQYLGTASLDELIATFNTESTHLGHGDKIRSLYSRFRPGRREPDFRAALRHPAGDVPGSRTYRTTEQPLFDGMMDDDDKVTETLTVDASDLFSQLMATSYLGKRNWRGRLDSIQEVSEGTIRVWREWLARQCETKSWTDGDTVVVHRDSAGSRDDDGRVVGASCLDPREDPAVLWLNTGRDDVGIKFRVKRREPRPNTPIVHEKDVDLAVSYQVEFEGEEIVHSIGLMVANTA